jgi:hypothetical protein
MAASPFRNFNPEALTVSAPIAGSYGVAVLILDAAFACNGNSAPVSNATLAALIKHVPLYEATKKPRSVSVLDSQSDVPALQIPVDVTHVQYHAARALLLFDEMLDIVAVDGWTVDAVDRLALASTWIGTTTARTAAGTLPHDFLCSVEWPNAQRDSNIMEASKMFVRQTQAAGSEHAEKNKRKRHHDDLKVRAVQLYEELIRQNPLLSMRKAAKEIAPKLETYAKEKGLTPFAPTNVERTVYEHLLKHSKKRH